MSSVFIEDTKTSVPAEPPGQELSATGETPTGWLGRISWALYEFSRAPYLVLVTMYVFAPYFTNTVIGDPVRGQEMWGIANTIVGIAVAILAPITGAMSDRMGRRKPWIVGIGLIMAPSCMLLWWTMPGAEGGLPVSVVLALIIILASGFTCGEQFQNSMIPSLVPASRIGGLSGLGLAVNNFGALIALCLVLYAIVLPATNIFGFTFVPDQPMFGLDPEMHEHERIVGPIAGVWLLLFHLPLLLWTPDRPATGIRIKEAVGQGFSQLMLTVKRARQMVNVGVYLLGRTLYTDAMVAIIAYMGIYGSGVFQWDVASTMLFGILIAPAGMLGGFLGGWIDNHTGSKRAIQISITGCILTMLGVVSITPGEIFFFIPYDAATAEPVWSFPYFQRLPEIIYTGIFLLLIVFIGAAFANSRAMMARISPLSMMSQFFGLYALSSTATAFLGHGMVATFTHIFESQRAGFASTLILLIAGFVILCAVKEERTEVTPDE